MRARAVMRIAVIALSLSVVLVVAGVLAARRLDASFRPPTARMLLERVDRDGARELLDATARRVLAGQKVPPEDRQRLLKSGVLSFQPVPDRTAPVGVRFEFGGADNHYGLLVTRESGLTPNVGYTVTQLEAHLWYYSEVSSRR